MRLSSLWWGPGSRWERDVHRKTASWALSLEAPIEPQRRSIRVTLSR
jgi:hypothetical protein